MVNFFYFGPYLFHTQLTICFAFPSVFHLCSKLVMRACGSFVFRECSVNCVVFKLQMFAFVVDSPYAYSAVDAIDGADGL